ncbi:MAG: hypothetical protein AB8B80_05125, partial [Marinicellaceae bacterium]
MNDLNVQVHELEVDLSNLFELLLVGNFNEDTDFIKQVSDKFNTLIAKLSSSKLEGLAHYFGCLQDNWERVEDYKNEHFDSIQNCIMHSLSMFDPEIDLEFLDQIEKAFKTWSWPSDLSSEIIKEMMTNMKTDMNLLINHVPDSCQQSESSSANELEAAALKELESASVEELEAAALKELESASVEELEAAALKKLESASVEELEAAALKELESASVEELEAAALKELESASVEELEAAAL